MLAIHHLQTPTHRLSGPDSKGMEIHCMCLCCSHTVHMGHECFLPTAAEEIKKSMTHSSVVSDGATDYGIVHNGYQQYHSSVPSSSIWQITFEQAEYILTYAARWDLFCLGGEWETCY